MAELSVQLKADIRKFITALDKAEKELKEFGETTEKVQKKDPFVKVQKGAANAVPTLQEFGRVIQDAPFGIQGVANNITQLTANFGNLSKSAGGAGAAFKSLIGSLAGPAGFLVAISAITSALVSYGPEIRDFILNTSDAEKAQRAFNDAINEGVGQVASETSTLSALLSVARDETRSKEDRQRAIAKINDEYKDLLPNLSLENVRTKEVSKAVDDLTTSLIRQAKIRGAQNLIAEKTAEILKLQSESAVESAGFIDFLSAAWNSLGNAQAFAGQVALQGLESQNEEVAKLNEQITNFQELLKGLISTDIGEGGIFTSVNNAIEKQKKKARSTDLGEIFGITPAALKQLQDRSVILNTFVAGSIESVGNAAIAAGNRTTEGLATVTQALLDFNEASRQIIERGIEQSFGRLAQAIGTAIATGANVINAGGAALLSSLGAILVDLGQMTIAVGVGIEAVKKALESLTGIGAIAAGVALVAIGSAFSAGASKLSGRFGSGGGVPTASGGSGFSGAPTTSSVGGFDSGRVVFEISGTSLVGVLSRTLNRNQRLGAGIIS